MNLYFGEEIPLEGLEAAETDLEIGIGETISPDIIYVPENTTNKALNWSSDNASIASVTNTGQITGEAEGTCTITATSPKDETLSLTWNVTVKYIELESISASTKSMTVAINSSVNAKVVYAPENATDKDLTWSSSDDSIARVDDNGKVTGVKEGSATITATAKTNTGLTATFDVSVTKDMTINTEGNQVVVYKGSQTVVLYKDGEKVRSMICSTGRSGSETPTGEYTVPAKYGSWYYFRSVGCWIQYGIGIRGNYLFHSVPYYPPAGTSQSDYNAYVSINGYNSLGSKASSGCIRMCARDIKWLYNNVSVGTKITITNSSGPSADYGLPSPTLANGKSYHWDPTDTNPNNPYGTSISSLSLSDSSISLDEGASKTLKASYSPSSAAVALNWSSSDKKVATVDDNGKVTALKAGTTTITAKDQFSGKSASCTVTVKSTNVAVSSVKLNSSSKTLTKAGETYQLKATVSPDNATNKNVTWSSSKESVATVNSSGLVTAKANGSATITAKTKDGGKTATCKITVKIDTTVSVTGVTLDKSAASLTVGESVTLKATVSPSNATKKDVSWSSSNSGVATVDSSGKVTAVAPGTAKITVTTNDGSKKATCDITVSEADDTGDETTDALSIRLTSMFPIPQSFKVLAI